MTVTRRFGSPSGACKLACPFAAARHGPGPKRGRLQVGGSMRGGVISFWALWRDTILMGVGRYRCGQPSPSRPSRTCVQVRVTVGPPATRSDPAWPADLAVAGRRPSYPSCIRVERVATRGAAGRGARQICATSPSRLVRRVTVAGLVTAKSAAAVTAGLPSAPGSVPPGRC